MSIGIQKGPKGRNRYGFTVRNDFIELILEGNKSYIKFGMKKALLYFIPVSEISEGFAFHKDSNAKGRGTVYASVGIDALPELERFLGEYRCDYDLKYDKNLELYYIDLLNREESR